MNQRLSDIWKFITYDIWRITESEVTRTKFSIYNIIKTIYLCVNRFNKDRIVNKASALTYSTLLAIVPILAIVFAIARGFGVSTLMESQFRDGFGGSTEATDIILQFVDSYLSQTKNGIFIGVGLVMLLWTVLNLVSNIEITFNRIWQVKKGRSMYRKITDYFSMFLLMPILIVVSGGLSIFVGTMLKSMADFVCPYPEIPDPSDSVRADLADVYGTLYLHAQYQGEIQACTDLRHPGRFGLSGISVPVHQQSVVGVQIQCHLR